MSNDHSDGAPQRFDVQAIRDRILPDPDLSPEERIKKLRLYIEEDYPTWRARHLPDPELRAHFVKILLSTQYAAITLIFEVLPTQSPLVHSAEVTFLNYPIDLPNFPTRSLHNQAIDHCLTLLSSWLDDRRQELTRRP